MNLSTLSVKRGVTFSMIFAAIFGAGIYSLNQLQLDLYPEMNFPIILVLTTYQGARPEDMETLVTKPIASAVASAKGATKLTSNSKQGTSFVAIEFDWGQDMDLAETDVRRKLDMIKRLLPTDSDDPLVIALDPSMQPIVMMTVEGAYPLDELRKLAEDDICDRVSRLDGVAACEAIGGLERQIRVIPDPAKLSAYGIDALTVFGAVGYNNVQEPGGYIEEGSFAFTIQTHTRLQTVEDIRNVIVASRPNASGVPSPVYLHQVADVADSFNEPTRNIEVNGQPATWIVVRKQAGENTVKAVDATMAELKKFELESEGRVHFGTIFSQGDFIKDALGNLSSSALLAVGITFIVLFTFLGSLRSASIVATAIPLSVVATFFVMDRIGMTLNVISMAGLALAVGMLVDNAIVVLENIFRLRQEGVPLREAAIRGAGEVSLAVTASTLPTVSVFVPVLFVPGIAGILFKDMAVTICFALLVSLLVAISFVPLAASRLLVRRRGKEGVAGLARWNPVAPFLDPYTRFLRSLLRRRWVVAVGLVATIAITALIATTLPTDFMAEQDQSMIALTLETPVGSNLDETTRVAKEAIEIIKEVVPEKDRKLISMETGIGDGFASIFSKGMHSGMVRAPLTSVTKRDTTQMQYTDTLRERLREIPDLKVSAAGADMFGSDIQLELRGHDLNTLRSLGNELETKLLTFNQVGEVTFSFAEPTPQLSVDFDREKALGMGIRMSQLGQAVATCFLGRTAGGFFEDDDEIPIVVRYDKSNRAEVDELGRIPMALPTGNSVPIRHVADIRLEPGPVAIERIDQERAATLDIKLKDSYIDEGCNQRRKDLGKAIGVIESSLKDFPWPDNFGYEIGGAAEDFLKSFRYLGIALIISVLLVYMVMASLFESFRQPFIILFTVPLALIGVVLTFALTGNQLDVSALIGVIMLIGIVVNNGIIMIDAANQQREQGKDRLEAIIIAARNRLRPVLLTSVTTITAMIPLALEIGDGSESWAGMAQAVIGGLTFSTVLTLIVVPTFYTFLAHKEVPA